MARGLDLVGGSSKLTAKEFDDVQRVVAKGVDAFKALGQEAPPSLQRILETSKPISAQMTLAQRATSEFASTVSRLAAAFSIANIVDRAVGLIANWTHELIAGAGALVDMSAKTGIGVEQLQRFAFVGKQAGVSVEDFASAAFKLGVRIDGGTGSVRSAVDRLGLSYSELRTLSPEEQFNRIIAAMEAMQDPQERNRIGVELFGKSFEQIAPAVAAGYTEMARQAAVSSEQQIKAIDNASDALDRFVARQKSKLTSFLGNWVIASEQINKLTDEQRKHYEDLQRVGGRGYDYLLELARVQAKQIDILLPKEKSLTDSATAYSEELRKAQAEVAALTIEQRAEIVAAEKLGKSQDEIAKAFGLSDGVLRLLNDSLKTHVEHQTKAKDATEKLVPPLAGASLGFKQYFDNAFPLVSIMPDLSGRTEEFRNILEGLTRDGLIPSTQPLAEINRQLGILPNVTAQATKQIQAATAASATFADMLRSNVSNALGSLNDIFQRAFEGGGGVSGAISSFATKALSGITSLIPGVGPIISQFSGAIVSGFKKLFGGPSQKELGARDAAGQFQKQFGSFEAMANAVGAAFVGTGRSAAQAEAAVKHLLDATHKDAAAVAEAVAQINAVFDEQKQDASDLQAAISKYGFSIEELGPKLQKQQLDEQAQALTRDFTLLAGAGIDIGVITERMGAALNDYVRTAQRTGVEVPAAMKPIIEKMIEQGKLTDENGNAFTDLSEAGITFSETLTQGFDRLIKKLDEIFGTTKKGIDDIANAGRAATDVINKIPDRKALHVFADFTPGGGVDLAARGGLVTAHGIQHFAEGGRVLPFLRRGRDSVPTLLTPGELVLNTDQQAALGGAIGAGAAALAEIARLRREMPDHIARAVRDGVQKVARR